MGIPVIALCQLSRATEYRESKRPIMADLRASGRIEEEADVIGLLYRPAYYLQRDVPQKKANELQHKYDARRGRHEEALAEAMYIADLLIEKQRMGAVGRVRLHFTESTTKFGNYAKRENE